MRYLDVARPSAFARTGLSPADAGRMLLMDSPSTFACHVVHPRFQRLQIGYSRAAPLPDCPSMTDNRKDPLSAHQPPLERLVAIMARLRDPVRGCPWDVQQSFATI